MSIFTVIWSPICGCDPKKTAWLFEGGGCNCIRGLWLDIFIDQRRKNWKQHQKWRGKAFFPETLNVKRKGPWYPWAGIFGYRLASGEKERDGGKLFLFLVTMFRFLVPDKLIVRGITKYICFVFLKKMRAKIVKNLFYFNLNLDLKCELTFVYLF